LEKRDRYRSNVEQGGGEWGCTFSNLPVRESMGAEVLIG